MDWIDVFNTLGISGMLTTLFVFLVKRYYTNKDKKDDKEDIILQLAEDVKEFEEFTKELKMIMEIIIDSQKPLLKDKIIQMYKHYYNERQYFPIYARESLQEIYTAFNKIAKDDVIDDLVNKLESLPTKPLDD